MSPPPPPKLCLQLDPKARPQPQYHPPAFPTASDCPRNRFYSAPQPLRNRSEFAPRAPSPSSKPLPGPLLPPALSPPVPPGFTRLCPACPGFQWATKTGPFGGGDPRGLGLRGAPGPVPPALSLAVPHFVWRVAFWPRKVHRPVGGWQLATGGWWRSVVVGGGWWLVIGGWWRLAVVGSWRLVATGGWWRLVAVGGWQLVAVGD